MALIRIVDEWLRSPVSPPTRWRRVFVVADSWGEQRVLMRAYASSQDQTRPTIVLHGVELPVGPAGIDPHGPWGIHVEDTRDGWAQSLREQLELAARRLAGTRGRPPRLADEESEFERKRTNNWAPGSPRDPPRRRSAAETLKYRLDDSTPTPPAMPAAQAPRAAAGPSPAHPSPVPVIPAAGQPPADGGIPAARTTTPADIPPAPRGFEAPAPDAGESLPMHAAYVTAVVPPPAHAMPVSETPPPPPPPIVNTPRPAPTPVSWRSTPLPSSDPSGPQGWSPPPRTAASASGPASFTAMGYEPNPRTETPRAPSPSDFPGVATLVGHTMPLGFSLSDVERRVLQAIGTHRVLTARQAGQIAGVIDGVQWMSAFMAKLAEHGLDILMPGGEVDGAPTYVLRS